MTEILRASELWVPTRGFPFYGTVERLNEIGHPYRFQQGGVSVSDVRNRIAHGFLHGHADVLVMVDDDVVPNVRFLELLVEQMGRFDVMGGIVMVAKPFQVHKPNVFTNDEHLGWIFADPPPESSPIVSADAVGTGCIAIKRRVLEKLPAPFQAVYDRDGMLAYGEDINFCRRAIWAGFKVGANYNCMCEHYDDVYANGLASAYMDLIREVEGV